MPAKTILFLLAFIFACVGALFVPLIGVLGYMAHYHGLEREWWAAPLKSYGIRYAFVLAAVTAVGIVLCHGRLRYGKPLLLGTERLLLLFLAIAAVSVAYGGMPSAERYVVMDHPVLKLAKILLFVLMLTHVAVTKRDLNAVLWLLVIGALWLGVQAYWTPRVQFVRGRLETVGGPDFHEANVLPAYLVPLLAVVAVQFARSRWLGRAVCVVAGVFATNALVLTRSRGGVVGLAAASLAAAMMAPRQHRAKVIVGLVVVAVGLIYLADPQFVSRVMTIQPESGERDPSAQNRLYLWQASVDMLLANPFGVGAGRFHDRIGAYASALAGKDAHNTFVRCYGELGVHGFAVFVGIIASAFLALKRVRERAARLPEPDRREITYMALGLGTGIVAMLACGLTVTLLYVEYFWWLLALPVCLERVVANLEADHGLLKEVEDARPASRQVRAREPAAARA